MNQLVQPPLQAAPSLAHSLGMLSALFPEKDYVPARPRTLEETGLCESLLEGFILKHLLVAGSESGRSVAEQLCVSPAILEERFHRLSNRQLVTHKGSLPLGDYLYVLTERGRDLAQHLTEACAYRGPAPVPLEDYVTAVEAQTIFAEAPRRDQLLRAFGDVSVSPALFDQLGPAVNSGAGLFLYGSPGNGKTTLAERITRCFGQEIWIPRTLIAEGEIIRLYDPAYHAPAGKEAGGAAEDRRARNGAAGPGGSALHAGHDERWVRIRRPTVVVGGELTLDSLEIRHNARTAVSEAPLQMKSNGGSLLIDDFGRQRVGHDELLNRWIVPLEKRYDFLTLASGKKIQVPFDQLIIFSTNLDPKELVDEAFLRRIPYKINVPDPDEAEFHRLFVLCARALGCEYRREAVDHLLEAHYRPHGRPLRRCHPRDLLMQVRHFCAYNELPLEMRDEYFDRVVGHYFTVVGHKG